MILCAHTKYFSPHLILQQPCKIIILWMRKLRYKKSEVICPRSQSQELVQLGFGLRQSGSEPMLFVYSLFFIFLISPKEGVPFLEVLQHQVGMWKGWSKLPFHLLILKTHRIYCPWTEDVSHSKLITTDTILDLSQKAEKP